MDVMLAASWTDGDLMALRQFRREKAMVQQDASKDKAEKREARKYEKAATLVLDFITGSGRCDKRVPIDYFPPELIWHIMAAKNYLGQSCDAR